MAEERGKTVAAGMGWVENVYSGPVPWKPQCSHLQNGNSTPSGRLPCANVGTLSPAQVFSKGSSPFFFVCVLQARCILGVGMHVSMYVHMHVKA